MFTEIVATLARFLDPLSLLLVFGGSALLAAMRFDRADLARALAATGPLVTAAPARDAQAARVAVNGIKQLAQARGLATADRARSDYAPGAARFLRTASNRLADATSASGFSAWGETDVADRALRHASAQAVWRALADAAPAMGLIGTVAGLVQMFAHMDDPAKVGPGMALALLTTFYGVVLANAIAAPIAERLERLSDAELAWQREVLAGLAALALAEERHGDAPARPLRHAA